MKLKVTFIADNVEYSDEWVDVSEIDENLIYDYLTEVLELENVNVFQAIDEDGNEYIF